MSASITTDPHMPCHLIDAPVAVSALYRCPGCGRYSGRLYRRDSLTRDGERVNVISAYRCTCDGCDYTFAESGPCFSTAIIRPEILASISA